MRMLRLVAALALLPVAASAQTSFYDQPGRIESELRDDRRSQARQQRDMQTQQQTQFEINQLRERQSAPGRIEVPFGGGRRCPGGAAIC